MTFSKATFLVIFGVAGAARASSAPLLPDLTCEYDHRAVDGEHAKVSFGRSVGHPDYDFEALYESYGWGGEDGNPTVNRRIDHIDQLLCALDDTLSTMTCENASGSRVVFSSGSSSVEPLQDSLAVTWTTEGQTRSATFGKGLCTSTAQATPPPEG